MGLDLTKVIVEDTQDEDGPGRAYSQKDVLAMGFVCLMKAMVAMMFEDSKIEDMYDKA